MYNIFTEILEHAGIDLKARTYTKFKKGVNYLGESEVLNYIGQQLDYESLTEFLIKYKIIIPMDFALKSSTENFIRAVFIKKDLTIREIYLTNRPEVKDIAIQKFSAYKERKYNPFERGLLPVIDVQLLKEGKEAPFRLVNLDTLLYWEKYQAK